jgi:hypothetical protein
MLGGPGFESPKYPDRVYNLSKVLYGLKQVPRDWYARLKTFLLEHGYVMGNVDKTLFTLTRNRYNKCQGHLPSNPAGCSRSSKSRSWKFSIGSLSTR